MESLQALSYPPRQRGSAATPSAAKDKDIDAFRSRIALLERPAQVCASMLFSEQFLGVAFLCPDGERIHAHRCIVAAFSPHMRAMLHGSWAENNANAGTTPEVPMPQSIIAVRALLLFFYADEVDEATVQSQMSDGLHLAAQHEQPGLETAFR